jgi:methionine biosynthesis protein MetW
MWFPDLGRLEPVCRPLLLLGRELWNAWKHVCQRKSMAMKVLDYECYWLSLGEGGVAGRFRIFADLIEDGTSVLDIGCGSGVFLQFLAQNKEDVKAFGIDVSAEAVRRAREKGVNSAVGDVTDAEFQLDDVYDYIVLSEILEHIPNPEELMLKLRGRFRKAMLISIPNIGYYPYRLRLLRGSFPLQWGLHPGEHLRYWTVKDFFFWVDQLGFRAEKVIASNGFPYLANWWPNLLGNQVVFVVREKRDVPSGLL